MQTLNWKKPTMITFNSLNYTSSTEYGDNDGYDFLRDFKRYPEMFIGQVTFYAAR